jgi:hypothetical protein
MPGVRFTLLYLFFPRGLALPVGFETRTCSLQRIALDDFAPSGNASALSLPIASSAAVWLCCAAADAAGNASSACPLLYGEAARELDDAMPEDTVEIEHFAPARLAADVKELPSSVRRAFGRTLAIEPSRVAVSHAHRARRLRASGGGAQFVDLTAFHGERTVLNVVVERQVYADGSEPDATWSYPCTFGAIKSMLWGWGDTMQKIDHTPWSAKPWCRDGSAQCHYTVRDTWRHASQGRLDLKPSGSAYLRLAAVTEWPGCDWYAIWNRVHAAIKADGRRNINDFSIVLLYLPRHCGSQAELAGKRAILSFCPVEGELSPYLSAAHEIGHVAGFGHAGILAGSAYDDASSMMGYSGMGNSMSLSLAHRHMFEWTSHLPWSMETDFPAGRAVTRTIHFADIGARRDRKGGPPWKKWGAKIDDGEWSWYVGYHSCAGYDSAGRDGWCGGLQISHRKGVDLQAFHYGWLWKAGDSMSFGTNNFITVSIAKDMPRTIEPPKMFVTADVAVDRRTT